MPPPSFVCWSEKYFVRFRCSYPLKYLDARELSGLAVGEIEIPVRRYGAGRAVAVRKGKRRGELAPCVRRLGIHPYVRGGAAGIGVGGVDMAAAVGAEGITHSIGIWKRCKSAE